MDTRLVELHRTIDLTVLGQRLRLVREAAGLTQTQLAGADVSTAYVSRIESGQRRPDLHLLERMAERAGSTLAELLDGVTRDRRAELRLELDYAELSLASGDAAGALTKAEAILDNLPSADRSDIRSSAGYVRAFALEAVGDLDGAIIALEDLIADAAVDTRWLRGVIALSRCYRESGDLGMAIEVGDRTAQRIEQAGLEGTSEAMQLTLTIAAAYFERGDTAHAVRLCKRAIRSAEELDSATARGAAYWNASAMASRRGELQDALALARRAVALFEQADENRHLARLRIELGNVLLRQDPPEAAEARETLEHAARELEWSDSSPMDRANNQLALGRANLILGETDKAMEQVAASLAVTRELAPLAAAEALVLQGEIALQDGDTTAATAAYHQAILVLSGAGADRRAAELWFELGGLLQEVGDTEAALDAYRRAAASTGLAPRGTRRAKVAQASLTAPR